ncbi:MAG: DNA internalization-related competence protein ComEC/Rec2 [Desulfotignum sp.]|nr:DNA internalization-related competence protein ComEC/Rec2 [Desulfotignum sp.]
MKALSQPVIPPLIPVFLAMMTGILAGSVSSLPDPARVVLISAVTVLLCFPGLAGRKKTMFWLCLGFAVWSGYHSYLIHSPRLPDGHISHFYNRRDIVLTGQVVSFARQYPHKIRITVDCRTIQLPRGTGPSETMSATGRVYLNLYGKSDIHIRFNDHIRFPGPIRPIRNFGNPGAFDYRTFLIRQGIFGAVHLNVDKIEKIKDSPPSVWTNGIQGLETIRNHFYGFVITRLDHRDGAHVMAALVTGIKHSMPPKLRDQFARAGTSHLLAISGLHMGILSLIFFFVFYRILWLFPQWMVTARARKIAGLLTLIPLGLYLVFSGFSPSTQRAFVMIALFMTAFVIEKQTHPFNTLAGAGIVILLIDPAALFSISFQLSFTAVFFIISGMTVMKKYPGFHFPAIPRFVVSISGITLLAGLGTFPLIAGYFNLVSLVQIPANLILVPVIGFVCLPAGLVSLMVLPLVPDLAVWLLTGAAQLVEWCTWYVTWLTQIPFAWSYVPVWSWLDIFMAYLVLGAVLCVLNFKKTAPVMAAVIIAVMGIYGFRAWVPAGPPDHLTITILDVGQGNAALIETIENRTILVDGGGFSGSSQFDVGRYVVAPFLWHQGITALDAVILTHPDADHMNGLVFILENFQVGTLVKNTDTSPHDSFERIMAACAQKKIPVFIPGCAKNRMGWENTRLTFFQCDASNPDWDGNDHSVVFKLSWKDFSMLFPGDIQAVRERSLAETMTDQLSSDVLLSPHHGSNSSSTRLFLDRVDPETVVVSCGFNNPYRFPHPEVIHRYEHKNIRVFRTDRHGAVTITSNGRGYQMVPFYSDFEGQ